MARLAIGLLGGSFNPAHAGHLHISREALKRLGLDQVWWLVSPQNPLKPVAGMAGLAERLASADRVARHPAIRVSDIERRLGTRYTVDTVRALRRRFPGYRFVWLMGADNLVQFPRWRRWTEIADCLPIAVFARGRVTYRALAGPMAHRYAQARVRNPRALINSRPPAWAYLFTTLHPASSTALRAARQSAKLM
tara:strand:- start:254 stop:835 length:582 start_codon:yes stop_codon:yes gene_type:complete